MGLRRFKHNIIISIAYGLYKSIMLKLKYEMSYKP